MRLRWSRSIVALAAATTLAGCQTPIPVVIGDETWTAQCVRVATRDCEGIARLFVNNLARNGGWVGEESGRSVRITPLPVCPPLPEWAEPGACWRAFAPTTSSRACMLIARQRKDTTEFGFGRFGGDELTGRFGAPKPGTTPC
jgi:hypothetical protein